ncbi:OTU domain-containing protein 5-A isoform X2 [Girardinichthys multiradiatus]|uniref:OTU domain-containing protein 5-A isoform X2 n=1 Tax=Girardinichthys multiradiatus TaxID=208333 RepID=UPI001FABF881|nr:OTU domain-containing protein 5-A isoform X2 [Girardinichthys multiradiatus]
MTILPKKKPSSAVGVSDHTDDSDRRSGSDPHQHPHPHTGRTGARPRASPPPWSYQGTPPSARDDRRSIEPSSRSQQASPPPVGSVSPVGPGDGRDSSGAMVTSSRGELVVSAGVVGCGGAIGGCCSGPGLSKRRRQAGTCSGGVVASLAGGGQPGVTGPGGVGASQDTEEGAGNNSEDEYENAARLQSVDPATVEQEHWFEKALREKKGFVIKKMKEDGACLFRAVADQVYGDQDMHEVVRKHCMDYLVKNADYFSNYVTEDFTTYINRKRKNNCHGNHIEMQAMAEMYNRPVEVYQYSTEPINTFHGIHQNNDEPIRVSYHRNIHYNSVVNPNKATIGVGLGLPAFKPGVPEPEHNEAQRHLKHQQTHSSVFLSKNLIVSEQKPEGREPKYADQSLMKSAIKTSEESWIEQQMLEDKKRATDWEATNEAIEEQVARESYLQWLQDQEKQARQPRKASATCSSATAAASSGLEDWSARSPRQRDSDPSHSDLTSAPSTNNKPPSPAGAALILSKPPSPCAPGPSNQSRHHLEYRAIMQEMSPTAFGLTDWEDDEILASVLAVSQQEYLDSIKHQSAAMHREREPSPDSS